MSAWDDFTVEFDDDGHLIHRGRNGWREPVCIVCEQPILWVLDMASFAHQDDGTYAMGHARCLWIREAFTREGRRAPENHDATEEPTR